MKLTKEFKEIFTKERKNYEKRFKEAKEVLDDGSPSKYPSETLAYWKGRLDQLNFTLGRFD